MQAYRQKVDAPAGSSFRFLVKRSLRFAFKWHFHPEYELTLIVKSRGSRFVGDNIAAYEDGDLVLLGPNLPHTWYSESSDSRTVHRAIVVQFAENFLGPDFFQTEEMLPVRTRLIASRRGLQVMGEAGREISGKLKTMVRLHGAARLLELLGCLELLARTDSVRNLASPEFVPVLQKAHHQRIDAVCQYLNEHYTESIRQPDVSKLAHLSPAAFSRFFKRTTGKTFGQYITELRVGRACSLLIDTDLAVTQVCMQSGFNNLSNFNRKFLELKTMTPRQFRRAYHLTASAENASGRESKG